MQNVITVLLVLLLLGLGGVLLHKNNPFIMTPEEQKNHLIQCWVSGGVGQLDSNDNYAGCLVGPPPMNAKPKQDG